MDFCRRPWANRGFESRRPDHFVKVTPLFALITAVTFADSSIGQPLILICEALCFTNEDRKRPRLEAEFRKPFGLA
jgi:hypothetical protein